MTRKLVIKISGRVTKGEKYGRKLGFPTANLDRRDYSKKKMKIKLGVWAGYVKLLNADFRMLNEKKKTQKLEIRNQKLWKAGIVVGPIDSLGLPKIEAHLLGFKGNLYGQRLTISLIKFIRPFRRFKSENELKAQIKKDIKIINSKARIQKSKVQVKN